MIRIIVVTTDYGDAANVGGPVHVDYRTFEVEAPEVEQYLNSGPKSYGGRSIVGVEFTPGDRSHG